MIRGLALLRLGEELFNKPNYKKLTIQEDIDLTMARADFHLRCSELRKTYQRIMELEKDVEDIIKRVSELKQIGVVL